MDQFRVFLVVSPVSVGEAITTDLLTGLKVYKHDAAILIGLTRLQSGTLYMVPFEEDAQGNWEFISTKDADAVAKPGCRLLHVDWDLGFM